MTDGASSEISLDEETLEVAQELIDDPILDRLRQGAPGSRVSRSAMWAASSRIAIQGTQFAGSIVLARLLLPRDYGLSAIVISVIAFANFFTDLGMAAAIVTPSRSAVSCCRPRSGSTLSPGWSCPASSWGCPSRWLGSTTSPDWSGY